MKKTLLSLALMTASATALAGDYSNGRITGMSGAGYATGGYADGVLFNPSLGASHNEQDDFALVMNGGAVGSADRELLDDLEELEEFIDELQAITSVQDLTPDLADRAIEHLNRIEDQNALVDVGGSVVMAIPNDLLSLSFIAQSRVSANVLTMVAESDYELLENSVNTPFAADDLESSVLARGAIVSEVGVALSKSLDAGDDNRLLLGVTPKRVTVETFIYSPTVADYNEDDFDADEHMVESSEFNVDAGVSYISGNMRYGLAVRDMAKREYETITGEMLKTEPRSTMAVGYQVESFTVEAAVDLNTSTHFATNAETQIARAGFELKPVSWLQLRAGVRVDMEENIEDTFSVGLGISPFDVVNLDVAAIKGDGDTLGGAVQLGLRF